ncbi:hypothetical protein J2S19_000404 [Metabacillus malikii]|uniref:Uncharacterized protein n=1 Tax=Metabacillus malikii TaxID=1504265 RepID=A0ABT9ZA75_9BACI|nr:hypothetical protein [Metabacillus malikii]
MQTYIRLSLFLISWISVIFIPNKKKVFIKYLPVTLFSTVVVMCEIFYFSIHKLWKVKGGKKSLTQTTFLLLFGPYIVLTVWSFYLSKGKFLLYILINFVGDIIYAFPIVALFKKLNVFNIKVKSIYFFLLLITDALLNFVFQKVFEKIYPQPDELSNS